MVFLLLACLFQFNFQIQAETARELRETFSSSMMAMALWDQAVGKQNWGHICLSVASTKRKVITLRNASTCLLTQHHGAEVRGEVMWG